MIGFAAFGLFCCCVIFVGACVWRYSASRKPPSPYSPPAPAAAQPGGYDGHNFLHHYAAYSLAQQQAATIARMKKIVEGADPKDV